MAWLLSVPAEPDLLTIPCATSGFPGAAGLRIQPGSRVRQTLLSVRFIGIQCWKMRVCVRIEPRRMRSPELSGRAVARAAESREPFGKRLAIPCSRAKTAPCYAFDGARKPMDISQRKVLEIRPWRGHRSRSRKTKEAVRKPSKSAVWPAFSMTFWGALPLRPKGMAEPKNAASAS